MIGKTPISVLHGRTSLTSSSAYLLTRLHPFFNPLPLRRYCGASVPADVVLLDPFAGTGSIPYQMLRLTSQQRAGMVICADIQRDNLEQIAASMALNSRIVKTDMLQLVQWNASGAGGNLRCSTVDGVVSGDLAWLPMPQMKSDHFYTDLPYGHRELSPSVLRNLYPRFLAVLAKVCRPGTFAVFSTAAAPLFRRTLAQQTAWQPIGLGWEHGRLDREIFINGMRVWVFLIEKLEK